MANQDWTLASRPSSRPSTPSFERGTHEPSEHQRSTSSDGPASSLVGATPPGTRSPPCTRRRSRCSRFLSASAEASAFFGRPRLEFVPPDEFVPPPSGEFVPLGATTRGVARVVARFVARVTTGSSSLRREGFGTFASTGWQLARCCQDSIWCAQEGHRLISASLEWSAGSRRRIRLDVSHARTSAQPGSAGAASHARRRPYSRQSRFRQSRHQSR